MVEIYEENERTGHDKRINALHLHSLRFRHFKYIVH